MRISDWSSDVCSSDLVATLSDRHSFVPHWRPRFISDDAPEDRCHLNGMAMRDGRPAFASCLAESDAPQGWRAQRKDGGVLFDIATGEAVLRGLSMPHSPRRPEERRVGKEGGSTCRARWSPQQ